MTQPETLLALGFVGLVAGTLTYLSAKLMEYLDRRRR